MTTLHLLQRPINRHDFIKQVKLFYAPNDSILLLDDAVFSLTGLCQSAELWSLSEFKGPFLALQEHLDARGLENLLSQEKVKSIDYQQFVELSVETQKTISW